MKCWALKTREDSAGRREFIEHWDQFVKENVVAIGWKFPGISLKTATKNDIINALIIQGLTKKRELTAAANTIVKFRDEVRIGDKILLCRGYAANYPQEVRLYGTAKITGDLYQDFHSSWWYKRSATIREVFGPGGIEVPRKELASILRKGSLLLTLQEIDCRAFDAIIKRFSHLSLTAQT